MTSLVKIIFNKVILNNQIYPSQLHTLKSNKDKEVSNDLHKARAEGSGLRSNKNVRHHKQRAHRMTFQGHKLDKIISQTQYIAFTPKYSTCKLHPHITLRILYDSLVVKLYCHLNKSKCFTLVKSVTSRLQFNRNARIDLNTKALSVVIDPICVK